MKEKDPMFVATNVDPCPSGKGEFIWIRDGKQVALGISKALWKAVCEERVEVPKQKIEVVTRGNIGASELASYVRDSLALQHEG